LPNSGALERRPLSIPVGKSVQLATYLAAVATPLFFALLEEEEVVPVAEKRTRRR